jgi:TolB-like protein
LAVPGIREVVLNYSFDEFILDSERRELRCGDALVSVEPQVFDLLEFLIRQRNRVVSKDELLAAVWQGRVVSESAMTTRINAARAAIGDSGDAQRLIRTLRGKGFRFVGSVLESSAAAQPDIMPIGREPSNSPLTLPDRPSIAVLPFVNLSGDPEQEFFADGITEDIITGLSQIREFFVIARNTMFTFKNRSVDVQALSKELGVHYVLEGSVRRAGGRVRISAQLNDGTTGRQIWASRYDSNLADIFALQDEITQAVVSVLGPELSRAEQQRALVKPPENLDAWELYYRGIFHLYKRTHEGNLEARRYFQRATERDPEFAAAYAGISRALSVDWILLVPERDAGAPFELARRAIELDERAATSHMALGRCASSGRTRW